MSKQLFDIDAFRAQPLPTEEEIMSNWQGDIEKPVVSVLCNTFNQATYIEDAFRGFLIQKTDFVFEVIVHDDASTDGTSDIVREYAKRYPKIFKPVIQTENQYSQGKKITLLSAEYARGEYIALCEGDDFWIDSSKITKQLKVLLLHPEINLCFTSSFGLRNDEQVKLIADNGVVEKIISTKKVIRGGGGFMPTASLFFQSDVLQKMPDWFDRSPVGDYFIQVIGSMDNGAIYVPINSCCYRISAIGSWSRNNADIHKLISFMSRYNMSLRQMADSYKKFRYDFIFTLIKANLITSAVFLRDFKCGKFFKYMIFIFFGKGGGV